ncbi:MAG: M81 family metallopeptidase [Gammaproteobacteria bacterium]|nr:M81 family metallopeptidase [Gammaproteobacteria bacterium]
MSRRVAILGISLESNRFAPVFGRQDFEEVFYGEGERLERALSNPGFFAFGERMSALREWEAVPILVAIGGAGGPMDHGFFEECLGKIEARLAAAAPVDGVYLYAHGAGLTTRDDDFDGTYFARVREIVGPDVPMIAVLDLHGIGDREMVNAADILIAYRTNPHVDQPERAREAADLMHEMWDGMRPQAAWQHVPMMAPSVTLGTSPTNLTAI